MSRFIVAAMPGESSTMENISLKIGVFDTNKPSRTPIDTFESYRLADNYCIMYNQLHAENREAAK